jgi:hypothetical protein
MWWVTLSMSTMLLALKRSSFGAMPYSSIVSRFSMWCSSYDSRKSSSRSGRGAPGPAGPSPRLRCRCADGSPWSRRPLGIRDADGGSATRMASFGLSRAEAGGTADCVRQNVWAAERLSGSGPCRRRRFASRRPPRPRCTLRARRPHWPVLVSGSASGTSPFATASIQSMPASERYAPSAVQKAAQPSGDRGSSDGPSKPHLSQTDRYSVLRGGAG